MMSMSPDPNTPRDPDLSHVNRPRARDRDAARSQGLGAIVAVVAAAAVIIVGLLYIMTPPAGTPAHVSSEAPSAPLSTPSPAPKPTPEPSK